MRWFIEQKWGAKSLVALYLSVLSGIVLSFQYDMGTPFYSTGILELVTPFGSFWRSLHFYSSQVFFLLLLIHLLAVLVDRYHFNQASESPEKAWGVREQWFNLVCSVPVAVLLLFTGYILRADATGRFAGVIAENILISVPLIGSWLNSFVFNVTSGSMKVVYANHLVGLGILWGYLAWQHLRKYRVSWLNNGGVVAGIFALSLLAAAPIESFSPGKFYVSGPWFFVGLQEMLRTIQPLWAGVVFPISGVVFLYLIVKGGRKSTLYLTGGILWIAIYSAFSLIGFLR